MEYRIRIKEGKERAFLQFIRALQSLEVVEAVETVNPDNVDKKEDRKHTTDELLSQYRDLVD